MEISCKCLNLISLGEIIRVGYSTKFGVIDYCNFSEVKEIVIDADGQLPNMMKIIITDINNRAVTLFYNGILMAMEKIEPADD